MDVAGLFSRHATKRAIIRDRIGASPYTYPRKKIVADCIYSAGASGSRLVSESLRPDVSGVVLFDPFDIKPHEIQSVTGRIDIAGADITGAVNNVAGYPINTRTIVVDGFDESTKPVAPFDCFYIAGDTQEYEITSTVKTNGVTTSISFSPTLKNAVLDNAVITLTPIFARLAVIKANDIALQGEVLLVPVKEFS